MNPLTFSPCTLIGKYKIKFVVIQSLSHVWLCDPWTATGQAPLSSTTPRSLLKFMSIEWMICYLTILFSATPFSFCLQSFPASGFFSNKSVLHIRWPKAWSFNFRNNSSKEYSGSISFRIDWFDIPAVQRTLESVLQQHNSKTSILWCSVFFMDQHAHLYMTTGKTIDLTIWTYVSKVMALLFNMLYRFVIGTSVKEPACQCRRCKRHGFDPWVRKIPWVQKIPWRRAWQSTPVFLPGESYGQKSLTGYSP